MSTEARVEIGKPVNFDTLVGALRKAAEEVGWIANVEDIYRRVYRLGSVREIREYCGTSVNLLRGKKPATNLFLYSKEPTDRFAVRLGSMWGDASEREISQYLDIVSRHLQS
ncbi:MAG: hypothetical protein AABX29_07550 [Nanoarchaeota archaeon]